jgi:hypothetical protein
MESPFHEYFKAWIAGDIECGSYFDWTLTWWEHRNDDNVHVVLYEDMKANPEEEIRKIAAFMGKKYWDRLKANPEILGKVVEKSSFRFMKETINQSMAKRLNSDTSNSLFRVEPDKMKFVRKGIVGDWTSHFSPEDNEIMEKTFKEKFAGTGLEYLWDEYGVFKKDESAPEPLF